MTIKKDVDHHPLRTDNDATDKTIGGEKAFDTVVDVDVIATEPLEEVDLEEQTPQQDNDDNNSEKKFPFPLAFCDPDTKKLMLNPVVDLDGVSHEAKEEGEEANNEELENPVKFYPNRALKATIEAELERWGEPKSMREAMYQWSESIRSGWNQFMERTSLPSGDHRPLPDACYCPISFDLIHEPVIDPDGHTYEKSAIYQWIRTNHDSPVTREPLNYDQLRENKNLLDLLLDLSSEENIDTTHPQIQRWKEEHATWVPATIPDPLPETEDAHVDSVGPYRFHRNLHYASTREELAALNRVRLRKNLTVIGILLVWIIFFFFLPGYFYCFLMTLVAASIIYAPKMARQRDLEARRREVIRELNREREQREAQQQRQREQQQA